MVGDGHAVGVPADIGDELLWATKGFLAVDDPLLPSAFLEEALKAIRGAELREGVGKRDLSFLKGLFHGVTEEIAHGSREESDGNEEVGFRGNPTALRVIEAATRCNDVEVGVKGQILIPCVQNSRKTDVGTQPLPRESAVEQCTRSTLEEHSVHKSLVVEDQRVELMGKGEDDVEIVGGKEPLESLLDPSGFLQPLALGAMAVTA
jgi:hypothetical protein